MKGSSLREPRSSSCSLVMRRNLAKTSLRTVFSFPAKEGGQVWSDHRLHHETRTSSSALQADTTAHSTVPADSNSISTIAIDDHKPGEIQ